MEFLFICLSESEKECVHSSKDVVKETEPVERNVTSFIIQKPIKNAHSIGVMGYFNQLVYLKIGVTLNKVDFLLYRCARIWRIMNIKLKLKLNWNFVERLFKIKRKTGCRGKFGDAWLAFNRVGEDLTYSLAVAHDVKKWERFTTEFTVFFREIF